MENPFEFLGQAFVGVVVFGLLSGRLDVEAHKPWLLKALWEGYECVGEFVVGAFAFTRPRRPKLRLRTNSRWLTGAAGDHGGASKPK